MAFFKTLKTLVRNSNHQSRVSLFHASTPTVPFSPLPSPLNPFSFVPVGARLGPLFPSSPLWNLSQCTLPLYFCRRVVKFPNDLILVRCLPIGLNFSSVANGRRNDQHLISERKRSVLDVDSAGVNEKFLNLPNLVSISRMVSGPVIGWMIMNEWYVPAFGALIVSGATDWLDGFIARKMGINSVIGSYLDPLADKLDLWAW